VGREPVEFGDPLNDCYATGFMRNDPDLADPVLFAQNCRGLNIELTAVFPGRGRRS
jgi:hypothetical protein